MRTPPYTGHFIRSPTGKVSILKGVLLYISLPTKLHVRIIRGFMVGVWLSKSLLVNTEEYWDGKCTRLVGNNALLARKVEFSLLRMK